MEVLTKPATKKARRTQAERTADTKRALLDATVQVIHRLGYGGATIALIAEEAGVTRGAVLHHFGTRAILMAEVINDVFERENDEYSRMDAEAHLGHLVSDWPKMLWEVFSKPSGLAVLEILQAARSDPELSGLVMPTQRAVENNALASLHARFGLAGSANSMDLMRLIVWAIRGLSIAQVLVHDPHEIDRSVDLFQRILQSAEGAGAFSAETID